MLAAYQQPADQKSFQLSEAFATTMSESRRADFERIAGKTELFNDEIDALREKVQLDLASRVRPPVLLKTHNARVRHCGYPIIRQELTLGAIYIVRNPLDVVDSVADHWGVDHGEAIRMMGNDEQTIGGPQQTFVTQYLESWSGHIASWIDQRAFPIHVVRYEDMLSTTELTFRNVLTYLARRRVMLSIRRKTRQKQSSAGRKRKRRHARIETLQQRQLLAADLAIPSASVAQVAEVRSEDVGQNRRMLRRSSLLSRLPCLLGRSLRISI